MPCASACEHPNINKAKMMDIKMAMLLLNFNLVASVFKICVYFITVLFFLQCFLTFYCFYHIMVLADPKYSTLRRNIMDQNINLEGCDTCKDKDCLEDMRVYFSPEGQMIVDNAISIRAKNSRIAFAKVDLDPVPFNRGYYAVNIHYYFLTDFEVYTGNGRPQHISGVSSFEKKVILFGGEGNTMTFSSDYVCNRGANGGIYNGPVAQVEVVEPIV